MKTSQTSAQQPFRPQWPGGVAWIAGWLLMLMLDGRLALGSLAMLLVLTAAIAALWLRLAFSLVTGLLAVVAFNWSFVPPRGTFSIDLHQDATLLVVMSAVSMLVAGLMSALRGHAVQVQRHLQALTTLREWGDTLRDAARVEDCATRLQQLLGMDAAVMVLRATLPVQDDLAQVELIGDVDDAQLSGLWYCLRNGQQLGPGTGRYQSLPDLYFPLRGRSASYGAVILRKAQRSGEAISQAQALCDQMGMAMERQHWQRQQQLSDQTAKEQELRATLLTAIAHDYRTPLATIMSAGSSLEEQDSRLNQTQRQQLAHRIVEESARLRQLTGNILQLARLDTPGVQLLCDWETAEELAGSAVQRCRQPQRVQLTIAPALPLLWCDSLLVSQLLDNLLENACKYSTAASLIRFAVYDSTAGIVFAVRDEGPGIPPELQQLVFQPFQQGQALAFGVGTAKRSGVGLGLALCRIVALAHAGELRLQSSATGSCFEFVLPHKPQPMHPGRDRQTAGDEP